MRFTTRCFIIKNSKELQKKLYDIGYSICLCANFENAEWLNTFPINGTIHGKGYFVDKYEIPNWTVEKELNSFVSDIPNYIDCGTNEELFLAIAALRDDSDKNQWFVSYDGGYVLCDQSELKHVIDNDNSYEEYCVSDFHKATIEELINHFK